jgi:hypothetical protein|tara:strand:+ start:1168 stop:1554 length:387 start_codon:yes stop_codon:yes gene_type:complete
MTAMSNYLENALINATLRNTSYTSPSTVYVALFTSDPTDAGSGTECSGGAYARQSATFAAPSDGASSISADVEFPQATGAWGTITHFGIFDASSSGNLLYHGALTASKTIATGDVLKITSSNLTVTLA